MKIVKKKNIYPGWELKYFDKANHFRNYQYNLLKKLIVGSVAEVGPGNGVLVKKYKSNVNKLYLYEPSLNLYKVLKKKFSNNKNIFIKNDYFQNIKKKFDTILFLDVIEHIEDDVKIINTAIKSLKKNGKIVINVPAFKFLFSNFDKDVGHFRRYNAYDINRLRDDLINKKQIKIYYYYYDCIGFFLSFINKILNGKNYKKLFKYKISMWNNLIWLTKLLDFLFFYKFGKSMFIVITKK